MSSSAAPRRAGTAGNTESRTCAVLMRPALGGLAALAPPPAGVDRR